MTRDAERHFRRVRVLTLCLALSYVLGGVVAFYGIRLAGDVSASKAARKAEIGSRYTQCVQSIPVLTRLNRFFAAQQFLSMIQLQNAIDMHKIATPGTAVYRQQAINLTRLRAAVKDASGIRLPKMTVAICGARRDAELAGRTTPVVSQTTKEAP